MTIRLKDSLTRNRLREADQQAHIDREATRRAQNMAALQARCAAVGCTVEEASQASTIAAQTIDNWLIDREAQLGLLPPSPPAPRWTPRCVHQLGPGLYALDAAAARQAVVAWVNAEGQRRGCPIEFGEGELASAIGLSGGEFLAVLDGRAPLGETRLVQLARVLHIDVQSIVWRRRSALQEL